MHMIILSHMTYFVGYASSRPKFGCGQEVVEIATCIHTYIHTDTCVQLYMCRDAPKRVTETAQYARDDYLTQELRSFRALLELEILRR